MERSKVDSQFSLLDFILIVIKRIKILLITIISSIILAIFYIFFLEPVFVSSSKFMSSASAQFPSNNIVSRLGVNLGSTQERWMYTDIVKSNKLLRLLLKEKFDSNIKGESKTLYDIIIPKGLDDSGLEQEILNKIVIDKLKGMIDISESFKTSIYTLAIEASEPKLAKNINERLIQKLENSQKKNQQLKSTKAKNFIQERIIETEKDLSAAEEALKNFRSRNRRIQNSPALLLEQERLSREVTVLIGVYTTLKQQLETTKIEELKDEKYLIIIDEPELPVSPSKPNRRRIAAISLILGISIGLVFIFLLEFTFSFKKEDKAKIKEIKHGIYKYIPNIFIKG